MRRSSIASRDPAYRAGSFVLALATAVIITALAFEHIGGHAPCPLCLQQRYAYYLGIPVTFAALVLLVIGHARGAALLFAVVALGFLGNTGLGIYHAGAEWKFWPGPAACEALSRPLASTAGELLKGLATTRVVRCDSPSWHFLGLSFAGWNVVVSALAMLRSLQAAAFAAGAAPNQVRL